jgi:hypothetical protein
VERQRRQRDQRGSLQFEIMITYELWEGEGGKGISEGVCSLKARSRTRCGEAKAETGSARGLQFESTITYILWEAKAAKGSVRLSAVRKHNHVHAVGRRRRQRDQRGCLQFESTITYILWEGEGGNGVSERVSNLKARSRTGCGKAKAAKGSARESAV